MSEHARLTEVQRQQVLESWNDTYADFPQDLCLHHLFEQQVQRTPHAVAVRFGEQTLTFAELNERANQLAHALQKRGVGAEVLVGVCLERSLEMIVGLLGVLKAGGAYVPLDPQYPKERLAYMIDDTQVPVLLTVARLVDELPPHQADVILLDTGWEEIAQESTETPTSTVTVDQVCYVVYTSGSTGAPKGVLGLHRGAVNRFHWMWKKYPFAAGEVCCQKTSLNFVDSVWEIWGALLQGVSLVLLPDGVLKDTPKFIEALAQHQVSRIVLVPSLLRVILETHADLQDRLPALKLWVCSGEALSLELAQKFQTVMPNALLLNLYGMSEVAADSTYFEASGDLDAYKSIPIGKPIDNTQVYVLDEERQLVPIGAEGELYIGGVGLSRGYWNRPDLTPERFVANPFIQGQLMYRTGDIGRYLPDGNIEYLGRVDDQVKIRGFRIEVREVEAALRTFPEIKQVLVMAREDVPGNKRLVAYLVMDTAKDNVEDNVEDSAVGQEVQRATLGGVPTFQEWQAYLQAKLPDYMVPSAFVVLDAFPLLPNGKVDKRSLPAPEQARGLAKDDVAPRNDVEEKVADIWAQVLGVERVGVTDNFFALGGQSLLATQIISRLRDAFAVELPLMALFAAPTVAALTERIAALRADGHQEEGNVNVPTLVRACTDKGQLSFAQQRMWMLDLMQPGSPLYNVTSVVHLHGTLDIAVLEMCLNEIVQRHDILRTTFREANVNGKSQPVSILAESMPVSLTVIQLEDVQEQRLQRAAEIAQEEAQKPFDLSKGPLFRMQLVRLGTQEHHLIVSMHHIVTDGWSMGIFTQELAALYASFVQGQPSPLAPVPMQYGQYAEWHHRWLRDGALDEQMAYWKQQLAGELPTLQLPIDKPKTTQMSQGDVVYWELSSQLIGRGKRVSLQENSTLFMTLLAAFQLLLYRYTGQSDLVIGTPIAGRNRSNVEGAIGCFINTLVLRTQVAGELTFRDLLRRVREVSLEAFAHQDVPFDKLVEALQPAREGGRSPLFQVMFMYEDTTGQRVELPQLSLQMEEIHNGTAKFDLTLMIVETATGWRAVLEYNTDLFERATITRMQGHFQNVLEAVLADPDQTLAEVPLLSEAERQQLLVEWNRTEMTYPRDLPIHVLFEQFVEHAPDAVAVTFGEHHTTYRELNERANQVAHFLQKQGVGVETLVGLAMERSLETVIGLLAILKAGGAYVPLDLSYPAERIAWMLDDTQVTVILTQKRVAGRLPAHEADVICLDAEGEAFAKESRENLEVAVCGDDLTYVMYTSGSTGTPKGVCMPHRGVVRLVRNHYLQILPRETFLHVASISFDASVLEIFGALLNGARLVVFPGEKPTLAEVGRCVREQGVTTLLLSSGLFHQLVDHQLEDLGSLRQLLAGGDVVSAVHARKVLEAVQGCRVLNVYGPTENATFTTIHTMTEAADIGGTVPIGRPIAGTQVYVLDRNMQPVPVGVVGELYAGGDGLARGYWKRPDLTAERFVDNPFASDPPDQCHLHPKLYKTGDLVRYLPDGVLEFVGRVDGQVKIRGYRIELGEIEAVLGQHPQVQDGVVVAREDVPGDKRVVAYVVPQPGEMLAAQELRAYLQERLPDFMVPSAFVQMEAFPLTPNDKVDRKALPAPEPDQADAANGYVAPRNAVEQMMANVWAELLGVEQVGVYDHFFELGGHSLLATQLLSRIRQTLRVELPLGSVFTAPTVAGLAEHVQASLGTQTSTAIPRVSRDWALPLSFAQQRLWFLDQLEPGSAYYNMPSAVRLVGALDVVALERSVNEIIRRHDALRTTFAEVERQPVQVIAPSLVLSLPVQDLRAHSSADEREALAKQLAQEEAGRPFDLTKGPLIRAQLLQLAETEHFLVLNMHHIVTDGWSMGVFLHELAALYEAFAKGYVSPLQELPIQYADAAHWQTTMLQGDVWDEQLAYWKQQLGGTLPVLQLPTDRPKTAVQTFRGAVHRFVVPQLVVDQCTTFGQQEGATPFMTFLVAFQSLLYRYTGQVDVLVGAPFANRGVPELEAMIGFFVNTLVLRTDLSGEPSVRELLRRVRDVAVGAQVHQDLPFDKLVEALQPERMRSHSPLFQVMFVYEQTSLQIKHVPGLSMIPVEVANDTAKFDLTLFLIESEEGLCASFEYNSDLFDEATIVRMQGHFETLLQGMLANPEASIDTLPLLPSEEQELVRAWNDTMVTRGVLDDLCIHQLVEWQVERSPDAVAVVFEGRQLTYHELNERANQVAHYLRDRGVQMDGLVGLCVERSLEMVVGLLGILKAGGAYVPLDPDLPQERLAYLLDDTQVDIVLTLDHLRGRLHGLFEGEVLALDAEWQTFAQESSANVESGVTPDHLAYVMYTSGSTGKPKGVMVPHRGVCNRLLWMLETYSFTADDRFLLKAPFGFDASVYEFFSPLLIGARLVVARPGGHRDPSYLVRVIAEQRVSLVHFVPSMMGMFLEAPGLETCEGLRMVIASGEALPWELQERFYERMNPNVTLHNFYGPTETSIEITAWDCVRESSQRFVPVGRPIANCQVHILDHKLQPVPIGVAGEMYLGGVGVTRGYWQRPDLTEKAFLPDPFRTEKGARLYKTGDVARYLPDGAIQYLGRADSQVKIRGFRIELGEIEVTLTSHPSVREAVVVVSEEGGGLKRLVAYIVPENGANPASAELRVHVKDSLPEYMVPSAIVKLETIPLSANGKVDRKALPAPDWSLLERETEYVAPRTPLEERLATIWEDVLGIVQIGTSDNFFALGGYSLLCIQVMARIRDALEIDLPVRLLFDAPTVEGLAGVVQRMLEDTGVGTTSVNPSVTLLTQNQRIPRRTSDQALPLSFAQQRLWFIDRMEQAGASYNIPYLFQLTGELQIDALERALQAIVERHEMLRTTFPLVNGEPVQVIAPMMQMPFTVVDVRTWPAQVREVEVRKLIAAEAGYRFRVAEGLLVRATLLQLGDMEHQLLLCMHHIVSDGWSMGVLVQEIAALYEAFVFGTRLQLAELPVQYADFALWQKEWLQGEVLEKQLTYWKQRLAGAATVLELPTDRPRPAVQTYRGADVTLEMPSELLDAVKSVGQQAEATLFMTLLAAFHVLLHRYTGQDDFLVGTPIAGRTRTELEGLIGFFVNTLVMRADLSDHVTFRELLARVRATALEAYEYQDVPFEKLVEELQPQRSLNRSPLFQVIFTLQEPLLDAQAGDLSLHAVELENGTSKVDLTLVMEETANGLKAVFTYNTDLFEQATITRMAGHLQTLLEGIVANPDQRLETLPLLTEQERQQMLVEWNQTQTPYPHEQCIHQLFEQQVERTPDAMAVVFAERSCTYAELNARANQVAHHLQRLGVGKEMRVGLSVERSLDMVVGMLGILKAGGAYVPLDPSYPQERLALMREDAQVKVLLTQRHLRGGVLEEVDQVVCVDELWEGNLANGAFHENGAVAAYLTNLPCTIDAECLAYLVYTSGSTGKPKGVCVPHRAVNRLVCNSNYVQLTPSDRVAQVSNTSFDAATFEIWGALLTGACLVGIAKEVALTPLTFAAEIKRQGITAMFLTTALFNQIASVVPHAFATVKHLLFGGEAVDLRWVREVQRHGAPERLLHVYGPTESTTFTTWQLVGDIADDAVTIPIGRPLANTTVYVLDRQLQPVPVGVPGELHIGGDGLAQGYWYRPELTEAKFIPHPFADRAGERLYKTGDLVRYLPDGCIEFIGRIDNQVKLRGFRIELGEIEQVLQQHPAVQEAVVIVREEVVGDKRLLAYVVPKQGEQVQMHELRHFAKAQLPDYMLPAVFVPLEMVSLTPNGKVDHRALPSPADDRPEMGHAYVAPRNEIERTIFAVWQDVLNVERVGIYDNFFDLGGHSLLVVKVHSQLQELLNRSFSIIQLFKYPTIDSLTQFLNETRTEQPTYQAAHDRARGKQDAINRRKQLQKNRGKIGE